ncbi:MAG TPA: sugar-binding domain-containing protein, partial [Capillimicrobium sp.]
LADVVVAATAYESPLDDHDLPLQAVATAAASYLRDLRPAPHRLGVSWGRTMHALASRMEDGWAAGVEVVQLNGGVSRSSTPTHADAIAARLAETGGGAAHLLAAPAIVERAEIRRALESDRAVAESLELARGADVAIFSLGALSADSVLAQSGYLAREEIDDLTARGCAGDLLSRFIGPGGGICDEGLDARTIGLPLEALAEKRRSIGVAVGVGKAAIARAAVAGGYVNALVVDEELAQQLLEPAAPAAGPLARAH